MKKLSLLIRFLAIVLAILTLSQCTHQKKAGQSAGGNNTGKQGKAHTATSPNDGEDQARIDSIMRSKTQRKREFPGSEKAEKH